MTDREWMDARARARPDALEALAPTRRLRTAALARPAVRRVAEMLHSAPGPMTARQIADVLGRHHTAVRTHLRILEEVGVVEGHADPPRGRGRPVRRYTLTRDPDEREANGHQELVRLLMGAVRQTGLGPDDMERFGERQGWGVTEPAGGVGELTRAFERLGFAPRPDPDVTAPGIILDHCPFADGVEAPGGELICVLHRGLARGIVARATPEVEVTELITEEPRRAGCRLRLTARHADRGPTPAPASGPGAVPPSLR